jgi:pilus assembly protein Flp/PilA
MHASTPQPFLNRAFTIASEQVNVRRLSFCAGQPKAHAPVVGFSPSGVVMDSILRFFRDEDGQDVVEYGLLIATIAIVVLVGVGFFGNQINAWFTNLAGRITTTGTP